MQQLFCLDGLPKTTRSPVVAEKRADSRQSEAHHGQNCSFSRLKTTRKQKCCRKVPLVPLNHCLCKLDKLNIHSLRKHQKIGVRLTHSSSGAFFFGDHFNTIYSWPLNQPRLHSRAESCHLPVSDVEKTSKGRHSKWPAPPNPQCPTWVTDVLRSGHGMMPQTLPRLVIFGLNCLTWFQ